MPADNTMSEPHRAAASKVLGTYLTGRDNNYSLIRMAAASAVLLSHCFTVASGSSEGEPLRALLGMSVGDIAVDIFFFASGLLVAGSLFNRTSLASFLRARALRIFPGLLIAVSFTVIIVGPLFTDLPFGRYFLSSETQLYWLRNVTLVSNVAHRLPGVFDGNPWPYSVNSSLWTLPYEIFMYFLLAALGKMLGFHSGRLPARLLKAAVVLASCALVLHLFPHVFWKTGALARLTEMFWVGVCFYLLRDHIRLSWKLGAVLLVLVIISTRQKELFLWVCSFSIPYLIVCAAYLPGGFLRLYNKLGDYSYGVYIYSFPIQQCIAASQPGISVFNLFMQSAVVTGVLAVLSWHFIESPMLHFKKLRAA